MKSLKRYQEKAIERLINRTKELFDDKKEKATIVFQSPTGSGKTFMISRYIEELIKEYPNQEICFLWISIGAGKLHEQSYFSLKRTFGGFPNVYLLENEFHGGRSYIERNEVVIVNWDKINTKDKAGDWSNILMKDSETYNFRDVVRNTRELGTKIVMIIDESHQNAGSHRAKELRDDIIKAHLTIEMSATPELNDFNERVTVNAEDVIDEGMIKKEIIVNDGLDKYTSEQITSIELLLKTAYSKRFELAKIYKDSEIEVNPLCLVQIPNGVESKEKQEQIEDFLAKNQITQENGKLAIWLSEDKINLEMLNDNENKVEFLIFKQAIATGWDCPRAQILVKFRDKSSETLEIQTVGRILRMPDGEHYVNDDLNKAYMYIDTNEFSVKKEDYNPNIIKNLYSDRKYDYGDLKLKSYYLNRIDYGDITRAVWGDLEQVLCKFFDLKVGDYELFDQNKKVVEKIISFDKSTLKNSFMLDAHLDTSEFDKLYGKHIASKKHISVRYSNIDLDNLLIFLIKNNLNGYAPTRSISPVLNAIRRWFADYLGISASKTENGHIKIRDIVLSNYDIFAKLINQTTLIYKDTKKKEIEAKVEEIEEWNNDWEILIRKAFNPQTYKKYDYKLSLYEPCYLSFDSQIEQDFIEYLELKKDKILWWWQNGSEHMSQNFGIKYNVKSTFQPDFIVKFNNGRIGIFDTKAVGYQEDDNKLKSEALQKYIKDENEKGKNLFGGLIIKDGEYFRINQKDFYKSFKDSIEDWGYLDFK
ncbi:MAG: DEAD/DEAH box helicase family protein [Aliarcobacter sp.]|jgi:type III restriction enzyme|nr:DEAD/DEAH box helicase family protein [Aliarcobacter sp.]